jgi:omega-3 fatty acid desaturase (delta-15 desaturase)
MAPCPPKNELDERIFKVLDLGKIRKAMPAEVFEKSLTKATAYMVFDYSVWIGVIYLMKIISHTSYWQALPFWQKTLSAVLYWNISGFCMWCLFIIGHDCGHSTFSDNELVNDIIGHIVHGSIMVPYYPWQVTSCFSRYSLILIASCCFYEQCCDFSFCRFHLFKCSS